MFSGIELTDEYRKAIAKIPNAELKELIGDTDSVTHVIVCDATKSSKIRRTGKLMAALCSNKCKHVLGIEWVIASGENSKRMDEADYTIDNKKYVGERASRENDKEKRRGE